MKLYEIFHQKLKNHVLKDFFQDKFDGILPFDLNNVPFTQYKSFGEKNQDKAFYVIYRNNLGAGFFSNFFHILLHFEIALKNNLIPVVDLKNFKTIYNNDVAINGTENAWEYYFNQPSPYSLEEVYQSKHVLFCNGEYPHGHSFTIDSAKKLFNVKQDILDELTQYDNEFEGKRVLGIHFRGKEMNICSAHPFGPTKEQIFKYTDEIIEKYNIDKIFLVTEDLNYLEAVQEKYKDKVFYSNAMRIKKGNIFNINPRENHRYLLGKEVLIDTLLLLKCQGLLHGASSVSHFANTINPEYEFVYTINNGNNVVNKYAARYLYQIKKRLPKNLGGLLDQITVKENRGNNINE